MKRNVVERTNKADIRPEEQSKKAESFRENLWNEIQLKGHKDRNRHKNRIKRSGQAWLVYIRRHTLQHPHHMKVSRPKGVGGGVIMTKMKYIQVLVVVVVGTSQFSGKEKDATHPSSCYDGGSDEWF